MNLESKPRWVNGISSRIIIQTFWHPNLCFFYTKFEISLNYSTESSTCQQLLMNKGVNEWMNEWLLYSTGLCDAVEHCGKEKNDPSLTASNKDPQKSYPTSQSWFKQPIEHLWIHSQHGKITPASLLLNLGRHALFQSLDHGRHGLASCISKGSWMMEMLRLLHLLSALGLSRWFSLPERHGSHLTQMCPRPFPEPFPLNYFSPANLEGALRLITSSVYFLCVYPTPY